MRMADILITPVSQPNTSEFYLDSVNIEADNIRDQFGVVRAVVERNISKDDLDRLLTGKRAWFFPGHGDALLQGERVLAFVSSAGNLEAISIDTLVGIVQRHTSAGKGQLELIVLTGCCTLELGTSLYERARVPHVVCWETLLEDGAGRVFGTAFAKHIVLGDSPADAFHQAKIAVEQVTESGWLDNGIASDVQMYQLDVDPSDVALVNPTTHRLRGQASDAPKGRIAAGKPRLLGPDSAVPGLGMRMPSPVPSSSGSSSGSSTATISLQHEIVEVALGCLGLSEHAATLRHAGFTGAIGLRALIRKVVDMSSDEDVASLGGSSFRSFAGSTRQAERCRLREWAVDSWKAAGGSATEKPPKERLLRCSVHQFISEGLQQVRERDQVVPSILDGDQTIEILDVVNMMFRIRLAGELPSADSECEDLRQRLQKELRMVVPDADVVQLTHGSIVLVCQCRATHDWQLPEQLLVLCKPDAVFAGFHVIEFVPQSPLQASACELIGYQFSVRMAPTTALCLRRLAGGLATPISREVPVAVRGPAQLARGVDDVAKEQEKKDVGAGGNADDEHDGAGEALQPSRATAHGIEEMSSSSLDNIQSGPTTAPPAATELDDKTVRFDETPFVCDGERRSEAHSAANRLDQSFEDDGSTPCGCWTSFFSCYSQLRPYQRRQRVLSNVPQIRERAEDHPQGAKLLHGKTRSDVVHQQPSKRSSLQLPSSSDFELPNELHLPERTTRHLTNREEGAMPPPRWGWRQLRHRVRRPQSSPPLSYDRRINVRR